MSAFLDETGVLITVDHSNQLPVALVNGFTVHRHIGGLEMIFFFADNLRLVHRHIGGLEK
ncbi:MAG: hypothetical protein KDI39_22120 [Pseudomonadales bacterium]|nr:hypothetical protein [Pseudomonadales bacterium]